MEEVGYWSTYDNGKPKMELCHHHGGGRLLVDLLDAHALGELKIELCHHHRGGQLLVDLQDAHDNGKPKMELCHHRRTHLTLLSIFSHVSSLGIFKDKCISPFA